MSNPWPVFPLTYDVSSLCLDDFTIFFWIKDGLYSVPNVRGEDTVVPALAGRVEGDRMNDTLTVILEGQITADPTVTDKDAARQDWWENVIAIRTLFASNRDRANLVAGLPGGGTATIEARPMNIVTLKEIPGEYLSLNIELEGYDDWTFAAGS